MKENERATTGNSTLQRVVIYQSCREDCLGKLMQEKSASRGLTSEVLLSTGLTYAGSLLSLIGGALATAVTVRSVGSDAYGVYAFILGGLAPLELLQAGMSAATNREVGRAYAENRVHELKSLAGTTVTILLISSLLALGIGLLLAPWLARLGKVPAGLFDAAVFCGMMVSATSAMTVLAGGPNGILQGCLRLTTVRTLDLTQTILRSTGVIVGALLTHSIVGVAIGVVVTTFLVLVLRLIAAHQAVPFFREMHPRNLTRARVGSIASFTGATLLVQVAMFVVFRTDHLVIGAVLGSAALAGYALVTQIYQLLYGLMGQASQAAFAVFTRKSASEDKSGFSQRAYRVMAHTSSGLGFLAGVGMLWLGQPVAEIWSGGKIQTDQGVIIVFALMLMTRATSRVSSQFLQATGAEWPVARIAVWEAVANGFLTLFLVHQIGVIGACIATLVAGLLSTTTLLPIASCRSLGMAGWEGINVHITRPLLAILPGTLFALLISHWLPASGFGRIVSAIVILTPLGIYGLFLTCFSKQDRQAILSRITGILRPTKIQRA